MNCKNCGQLVEGKFCNHCGQKTSVGTLDFHEILHEAWHNFTHTDKGYLPLAGLLLRKPGIVISEYLGGKRKKYSNPFTFYLVTTSLLLLVSGWVFQKEFALLKVSNPYGNYVSKKLNLILFCALPVMSILLWLFFKKKVSNIGRSICRNGICIRAHEFLSAADKFIFSGFYSLAPQVLRVGGICRICIACLFTFFFFESQINLAMGKRAIADNLVFLGGRIFWQKSGTLLRRPSQFAVLNALNC